MCERVVGGQPGSAAANEGADFPQLVSESSGVGAHGRVGNEPTLRIATARAH